MQTIEKTEGIVLRVSGFSNTSHMISWLTPDLGRLTTSVKGACRPKSLFLGQYDLYYSCELLYYAHAHQGIHTLRECSPLNPRTRFRSDWRAALAASYVTDVARHVSDSAPHSYPLYALLQNTLDALDQKGASSATLLAFESRLVSILGIPPDLEGCPQCSLPLASNRTRFSIPDGRIVCPSCNPEAAADAGFFLSRKQLATLRMAFASDLFAPSIFSKLDPPDLSLIRRFLGIFLHYHLDTRLDARAIAWDAI